LLCNMTVTLLWKCNELIVTQQELLRYYSNATTDLTCHNIINLLTRETLLDQRSDDQTNCRYYRDVCEEHLTHHISIPFVFNSVPVTDSDNDHKLL
jgi:hypothetical protein